MFHLQITKYLVIHSLEDDEWLVKPKSPGFQGAENPAADRGRKYYFENVDSSIK